MDYNWLYKDDSGASRGPHSGALINAWFKSGFFDKSRLIKKFTEDTDDEEGEWFKLGDVPELLENDEPDVVEQEEIKQEEEEVEEEGESLWVYMDDEGNVQGPYSAASIHDWLVSGFFDGERNVAEYKEGTSNDGWVKIKDVPKLKNPKKTSTANEAPKAESEYDAYLNEYYKNYYAQYYAQQVAEYEQKLEEYEEAKRQAEEIQGEHSNAPPEDGYVIPKPQFVEYTVKGTFDKVKGRFMAEGTGGSEYWAWQGLQGDKEGRQLDHYYDVEAFNRAQAAGIVVGNKPDKKKAKKERNVVPSWMREDPLEGAFKTK